MGKYTITEGFIVLDENSNIVEWFDTEEEAQSFIDEQED